MGWSWGRFAITASLIWETSLAKCLLACPAANRGRKTQAGTAPCKPPVGRARTLPGLCCAPSGSGARVCRGPTGWELPGSIKAAIHARWEPVSACGQRRLLRGRCGGALTNSHALSPGRRRSLAAGFGLEHQPSLK